MRLRGARVVEAALPTGKRWARLTTPPSAQTCAREGQGSFSRGTTHQSVCATVAVCSVPGRPRTISGSTVAAAVKVASLRGLLHPRACRQVRYRAGLDRILTLRCQGTTYSNCKEQEGLPSTILPRLMANRTLTDCTIMGRCCCTFSQSYW